jgi:sulfate transport system ATP-binding protein
VRIEIERLSKHFGEVAALQEVSLSVETGELVALLGPSGSGKTTLLRILAGLERPDRDGGRVLFDGADVTRATPAQRGIGLVFQHYALFKHLTVRDNVTFGLALRRGAARVDAEKQAARARELLALVQLDGLGDRYPAQLSGGQRQRVALARALAVEPRVLLLDEPFGALDAQVRKELRRWLRELHAKLQVTTVFITHDQEEALELADRLAVLQGGVLQQVGPPNQVYEHPVNPFVLQFLGRSNRLTGRSEAGAVRIDGVCFPVDTARLSGEVAAYVRPHDIELLRTRTEADSIAVTVQEVQVIGPAVRVVARAEGDGALIEVDLTRTQLAALDAQPGQRLFARLAHVVAFARY